jgi:hypothetical protein
MPHHADMSEMSTRAKLRQYSNAFLPIEVTEAGMLIEVNALQK